MLCTRVCRIVPRLISTVPRIYNIPNNSNLIAFVKNKPINYCWVQHLYCSSDVTQVFKTNSVTKSRNRDLIKEKIAYLAQEIFQHLENNPKTSRIAHLNQIEETLQILYNHGVSAENISRQFIETPDILLCPSQKIDRLFHFFQGVGFEADVTWKNIVLCPKLVNLTLKELELRFTLYGEFVIGDICSLIKLINRLPSLYLEDPYIVIGKVQWILQLFPPAETVNIIRNCPIVLAVPTEDTYKKIEYIYQETGFDQKYISQCLALEKSLYFISCRVQFLKRRGQLYKHNMEKDRSTYKLGFSANQIFDTNNREFVYKVASTTWEEFDTFCRLLEEETLTEVNEEEEMYLVDDDYDGIDEEKIFLEKRPEFGRKKKNSRKRKRKNTQLYE